MANARAKVQARRTVSERRRRGQSFLIAVAVLASAACGEVTPAGNQQQAVCADGDCDGGAAAGTGAGGARASVPTEKIVPPCTICRRAENCCKAQGFADCGYTAACANASSNQEVDYTLALCRAVLGPSNAGSHHPPAACGRP